MPVEYRNSGPLAGAWVTVPEPDREDMPATADDEVDVEDGGGE